ncbi:hypothetical protein ACFVRD_42100 [Streptomyces sp. NPDC057908]|uniref:hypothetical protein n=1 Tax=Streptomyces sp. NPDC057908 TaxID=3346276 RepID=UPI0036F17F54
MRRTSGPVPPPQPRRTDPFPPPHCPVLLAAGLLPVPALLANDAPAAAWGLWGATTIAAALVYAVGDTLRDVPPRTREAAQAGRRP